MTQLKGAKDLNRHFPTEDINWPTGTWKVLNITNHQGNENQSYSETSSHICLCNYYWKNSHQLHSGKSGAVEQSAGIRTSIDIMKTV
jgi:hypothetical protein